MWSCSITSRSPATHSNTKNLWSFCTHTGEKESHINMDLVVIKLVDIIEFLKVQ